MLSEGDISGEEGTLVQVCVNVTSSLVFESSLVVSVVLSGSELAST